MINPELLRDLLRAIPDYHALPPRAVNDLADAYIDAVDEIKRLRDEVKRLKSENHDLAERLAGRDGAR